MVDEINIRKRVIWSDDGLLGMCAEHSKKFNNLSVSHVEDIHKLVTAITDGDVHIATHMTVYAVAPHVVDQNLAVPIEV